MSKMSEMLMEIEDMLKQGMDVGIIARTLGIPANWVVSAEQELQGLNQYDGEYNG